MDNYVAFKNIEPCTDMKKSYNKLNEIKQKSRLQNIIYGIIMFATISFM